MKNHGKSTAFLGLFFGIVIWGVLSLQAAQETPRELEIVFTSDVHSHLEKMGRIAAILDEIRQEKEDFLLVDGGDFSMGTLFQTIYSTEAPELGIFGELGYDAATLGNHEFDYRSKGLANMLNVAAKQNNRPELLICNVDWEAMEEDMSEGQKELSQAFHSYGIRPYTVIQKGEVKIAVIGVFGKDALACAPTCELEIKDPILSVKQTVAQIEKTEDVDMIVCLSHSGISDNPKKSEDEELAKAVPELDVIISGHTHTRLEEPIISGNTHIVAAGEYAGALGSLSLKEKEEGIWELLNYELIPVDETGMHSISIENKVSNYKVKVDEGYLEQFGYKADQILAYNPYDFSGLEEISEEHREHNLGSIIADSYRYAANKAEEGVEPVVTVVPSGTIRDTYKKGNITVEDVFNSFSLGIGPDEIPGYPLICAYLTGEELKTTAEIDASVSDYMESARLYCSGLNFSYNPNRIPLNKVTEVYLTDTNGQRIEIENDKLYPVVADLYTGQMLGAIEDVSYGILSVVPKFADGTPIENMEDAILYENGREIKAWDAIASYMQSSPLNEDNIPQIPVKYSSKEGRKVVNTETGIGARLNNLNKYSVIIICIMLSIGAVIVVFTVLTVKRIKKLKKK